MAPDVANRKNDGYSCSSVLALAANRFSWPTLKAAVAQVRSWYHDGTVRFFHSL